MTGSTRMPHSGRDAVGEPEIDPTRFRQILGHYPTGVTVVTAIDDVGESAAMVIGSFTSVSLDPPLVAYLPAKSSTTYPRLATSQTFVVNILAAEQEELSRIVGSKNKAALANVAWHPASSGAPIFDESLAWLECRTEQVVDAGDHWIVVGRVLGLDSGASGLPLVFFQGGFGRFLPFSVVMPSQADAAEPIRLAETARSEMELLGSVLGCEVTASAVVGDLMVTLARAGAGGSPDDTWVGLRTPFLPPLGSIYVAWSEQQVVKDWLHGLAGATETELVELERGLARVRERGWSMSLRTSETADLERIHRTIARDGLTADLEMQLREVVRETATDYTPELEPGRQYVLRIMNVPVFGADGDVVLTLQTRGEPEKPMTADQLTRRARAMRAAAASIMSAIGGQYPSQYSATL